MIIRHGTYLTVYSNLFATNVLKGDKIKLKQTIGQLYDDQQAKRSVLGFQIWHNRDKLNPLIGSRVIKI